MSSEGSAVHNERSRKSQTHRKDDLASPLSRVSDANLCIAFGLQNLHLTPLFPISNTQDPTGTLAEPNTSTYAIIPAPTAFFRPADGSPYARNIPASPLIHPCDRDLPRLQSAHQRIPRSRTGEPQPVERGALSGIRHRPWSRG